MTIDNVLDGLKELVRLNIFQDHVFLNEIVCVIIGNDMEVNFPVFATFSKVIIDHEKGYHQTEFALQKFVAKFKELLERNAKFIKDFMFDDKMNGVVEVAKKFVWNYEKFRNFRLIK